MSRCILPPRRIALHAACVGGGLAAYAVLRCGAEAAFRPVGTHLDFVTAPLQFLDRGRGQAALHHQYSRARRARPEGQREVLDVPGWGVNCLLQVHFAWALRWLAWRRNIW